MLKGKRTRDARYIGRPAKRKAAEELLAREDFGVVSKVLLCIWAIMWP
jgi:hypothetical protein